MLFSPPTFLIEGSWLLYPLSMSLLDLSAKRLLRLPLTIWVLLSDSFRFTSTWPSILEFYFSSAFATSASNGAEDCKFYSNVGFALFVSTTLLASFLAPGFACSSLYSRSELMCYCSWLKTMIPIYSWSRSCRVLGRPLGCSAFAASFTPSISMLPS